MPKKIYKTDYHKSLLSLTKSKGGFTLAEILMVVAILGIISSLLLSVFFSLADYRALEREAAEVKALLEEARMYTQASRYASSHGVYFGTDEMELFRGESWAGKDESIKTYRFNSSISISTDDLGGGNEVVFHRLFGKPDVFGDIVLSGPKRDLTVTLLPSGIIE